MKRLPRRHRFLKSLAPAFHGITLGQWRAYRADPDLAVDREFRLRAATTTMKSALNSVTARLDERRFGASVRSTPVLPPVIILGHWRSGTTFLHHLLALDPRFAFPTFFQVNHPQGFLTMESGLVKRVLDRLVPSDRLVDETPMSLDAPQEDEFAVWNGSGLTPYASWNFPRARHRFDRFLSFREATGVERSHWLDDLEGFLRKLTFRYRRPLVLKSPPHTARIALLLERFPEARFVHISRHPHAILGSMRKLNRFVLGIAALQRWDEDAFERRTLEQFGEMYEAYFSQRDRVTKSRLVEIRYETLVADPKATLRRIYEALGLGDFAGVELRVDAYLDATRNAGGSRYDAPDPTVDAELRRRADRYFGEWGY